MSADLAAGVAQALGDAKAAFLAQAAAAFEQHVESPVTSLVPSLSALQSAAAGSSVDDVASSVAGALGADKLRALAAQLAGAPTSLGALLRVRLVACQDAVAAEATKAAAASLELVRPVVFGALTSQLLEQATAVVLPAAAAPVDSTAAAAQPPSGISAAAAPAATDAAPTTSSTRWGTAQPPARDRSRSRSPRGGGGSSRGGSISVSRQLPPPQGGQLFPTGGYGASGSSGLSGATAAPAVPQAYDPSAPAMPPGMQPVGAAPAAFGGGAGGGGGVGGGYRPQQQPPSMPPPPMQQQLPGMGPGGGGMMMSGAGMPGMGMMGAGAASLPMAQQQQQQPSMLPPAGGMMMQPPPGGMGMPGMGMSGGYPQQPQQQPLGMPGMSAGGMGMPGGGMGMPGGGMGMPGGGMGMPGGGMGMSGGMPGMSGGGMGMPLPGGGGFGAAAPGMPPGGSPLPLVAFSGQPAPQALLPPYHPRDLIVTATTTAATNPMNPTAWAAAVLTLAEGRDMALLSNESVEVYKDALTYLLLARAALFVDWCRSHESVQSAKRRQGMYWALPMPTPPSSGSAAEARGALMEMLGRDPMLTSLMWLSLLADCELSYEMRPDVGAMGPAQREAERVRHSMPAFNPALYALPRRAPFAGGVANDALAILWLRTDYYTMAKEQVLLVEEVERGLLGSGPRVGGPYAEYQLHRMANPSRVWSSAPPLQPLVSEAWGEWDDWAVERPAAVVYHPSSQ
jgi:hypothetical protein